MNSHTPSHPSPFGEGPGVRSTPEPRPEETSITTKPTAEEQMLQTESLKNCTRAGVQAMPEFDPDQIEAE